MQGTTHDFPHSGGSDSLVLEAHIRGVAQWLEPELWGFRVVGSNPTTPTISLAIFPRSCKELGGQLNIRFRGEGR